MIYIPSGKITFYDRVKETSTTTGTGSITLSGATTSFRTFSSVLPNGSPFYYCIDGGSSLEWEIGLGIMLTSTTFSRGTLPGYIISSSNADSIVSFSAGTKIVELTTPSFIFNSSPRRGLITQINQGNIFP